MRARWLALLVAAGCPFDAGGIDTAAASLGGSTGTPTTDTTDVTDVTGPAPTTGAVTTGSDEGAMVDSGDTGTTARATTSEGGESSSSSTGGRDLPACPQLLWIAGSLDPTTTTDGPYHAALVERGYDIEMMLDTEALPSDGADKCAVLISSVSTAAELDPGFLALDRPIITWELNLFDILGYTGVDDVGTYDGTDIEILLGDHPLAAGHVGTVQIHSGVGLVSWGLAPGESIVASVPGVPSQATIIAFDTGAPMPGIANAPARRVGLPFHNAVDATPTPAALELLAVAVEWATSG